MCKIAIIEQSTLFSFGITKILNEVEDFNVVAQTEDADMVPQHFDEVSPNVIIFDIHNYPNGGIKPIKKIRRLYPKTPLLLITSKENGFQFEEYIRLGVKGMILDNATPDQLIKAIHKLEKGDDYFKTNVWNILKDNLRYGNSGIFSSGLEPKLSEREKDVARLFCEGLSYKEIGNRLSISPRTVESHRNNILSKLNLDSLAGLIRYSLKNNL